MYIVHMNVVATLKGGGGGAASFQGGGGGGRGEVPPPITVQFIAIRISWLLYRGLNFV